MAPAELGRALRVDRVLPALAERAVEADRSGEFPLEHVRTISEAGLLGITVPVEYGGLGGGLRDLSAATFAMATACPSTALAYFFQCSGSSRGLLPLAAADAGLFDDEDVPLVRAFGEKVLRRMGAEGRWVANFASESVRSKDAAVTIATEASRTAGGWLINGVKSFGCATGVADDYLVTAKLEGGDTAESLAVFLVPRDTPGVSDRAKWDAIGMRATATHGIVLEDAFVPDENALTVPGTFVKMTQVSRGSFVGNQVALSSVYVGAAQAVYDFAMGHLTTTHLPRHRRAHRRERPAPSADRQDAGPSRRRLCLGPAADPAGDRRPRADTQGRRGGQLADRQGRDRRQLLPRGRARAQGLRHRQHRDGRGGLPGAARPVHGTGPGLPSRAGPPRGRLLSGVRSRGRPVRHGRRQQVNRITSRPWFGPGAGAFLYLTGMNDEALHHIGTWWLGLGRWGQTGAVLAALALALFFVQGALNRRRDAYRSAVRAAELTRPRRRHSTAAPHGPANMGPESAAPAGGARHSTAAQTGPTTKGF